MVCVDEDECCRLVDDVKRSCPRRRRNITSAVVVSLLMMMIVDDVSFSIMGQRSIPYLTSSLCGARKLKSELVDGES
jgi:hypothetical protein